MTTTDEKKNQPRPWLLESSREIGERLVVHLQRNLPWVPPADEIRHLFDTFSLTWGDLDKDDEVFSLSIYSATSCDCTWEFMKPKMGVSGYGVDFRSEPDRDIVEILADAIDDHVTGPQPSSSLLEE